MYILNRVISKKKSNNNNKQINPDYFQNGPKFFRQRNLTNLTIFTIHDKKILASESELLLVIRLNDNHEPPFVVRICAIGEEKAHDLTRTRIQDLSHTVPAL